MDKFSTPRQGGTHSAPSATCPALLVLLALFGAAACEEDVVSVLRPEIVLDPPSGTILRFDEVILTRTVANPIKIRVANIGTGALNFDPPRIEGSHAELFKVTSYPRQVIPSSEAEIFLRFSPNVPAQATPELVLTHNDRDQPEARYPLVGPAREPCVLFADLAQLFFEVGDVKELRLTAISTQDCTIDRLFTDPSVFPLVDPPPVPFVLPAGQTLVLKIEHVGVNAELAGVPVRELQIRETEGQEIAVTLEGEPPLFNCLSFNPDALDFGVVKLGDTSRRRVTLRNSCRKPAAVISAVIGTGWDNFFLDAQTFPASLRPGTTLDLWMTYRPTDAEGGNGRLVINTNDAANPRFRVTLNGKAALPAVEFFPSRLDFGNVIHRNPAGILGRSECSSNVRTVQVHNVGSAALTIRSLGFVGGMDQEFLLTGVTVGGQPVQNFNAAFMVPEGQYAELGVLFYPTHTMPSEHRGVLSIGHNASINPVLIDLAGVGTMDGPVRDVFRQLPGPKQDILWVIDDSCSMWDEQSKLVTNLTGFIDYADGLGADYQMAVTDTDGRSPNAGKFEFCYPYPRVISNTFADREAAFDCLFQVGTDGAFIEAGGAAALRAIQWAQLPETDPFLNPNAGFLRDDANLTVVMVSDEEDQSIETISLLVGFFNSVKGPGRTKVHAIGAPVTEACPNRQTFDQGRRYRDLTQAMGGLFFNICDEDWSPLLTALGLDVFVPLDLWTLSQQADPSSLTVEVDGVSVIRSALNGFTYNASTNTIQFSGPAIPQPGQEIVVDYLGNCRP